MTTHLMADPRRRTLLIFIFVMAFQQGVTINLLPVLFTSFAETFQLDLQQRGQIQSFFFVGAMVALFASGFVTERIAARRSALLALGLSGLGSILVALAPDFLLLRLGAAVMGMGTLWALSVTSATIAAHFAPQSQRLFMWIMAVFALAGTGAPYGLGHLVSFLEVWRPILVGVGLYLWVSGVAVALLFWGAWGIRGVASGRPDRLRGSGLPGTRPVTRRHGKHARAGLAGFSAVTAALSWDREPCFSSAFWWFWTTLPPATSWPGRPISVKCALAEARRWPVRSWAPTRAATWWVASSWVCS